MQHKSHTYFVTGAAGFIGSHLCRKLLKENNAATIVAIDNFNTYYDKKIKERRIKELSDNPQFFFYKTSVLEQKTVNTIVAKYNPDTLIHAAAEVGVRSGELNPIKYFSTNVLGTLTILELIRPSIKHALIFSSSSVYGSIKQLPFAESAPLTPSTPISVYGSSKLAMETAVLSYYQRTGIPITVVRPFSIYGPDGRPDMLPIKMLIAAKKNLPLDIYGPRQSFRDWTYIDTCIDCLMAILQKPDSFQVVNIGSGQPLSLNDTIVSSQKIIKKYGYSLRLSSKPVNRFEVIKTWADVTKLKAVAPHRKTVDYETGFNETAKFFFSHSTLYQ